MMGERTEVQEALFYEISLESHVPASHLVRAIDRFVGLSGIRAQLRPFYSETGRPSIDPELMIRRLFIGYCFGVRSERRLGVGERRHAHASERGTCRRCDHRHPPAASLGGVGRPSAGSCDANYTACRDAVPVIDLTRSAANKAR